jgi:hypothetical protein
MNNTIINAIIIRKNDLKNTISDTIFLIDSENNSE